MQGRITTSEEKQQTMTHKNTLQTVLRFIAVTGIALGVIYLYAILHEGGHALFVLVFGGELTEFEINFLVSKPHISYTGINDPLRQALVSLGGGRWCRWRLCPCLSLSCAGLSMC